MKSKFDIEKEVQKTLRSLDDLERVKGNPYLFTRINAHLEKEQEAKSQQVWQFSSILSWSMMALLLAVNIFVISGNINSNSTQDSLVESIASDYGFEEEETDYFNQN